DNPAVNAAGSPVAAQRARRDGRSLAHPAFLGRMCGEVGGRLTAAAWPVAALLAGLEFGGVCLGPVGVLGAGALVVGAVALDGGSRPLRAQGLGQFILVQDAVLVGVPGVEPGQELGQDGVPAAVPVLLGGAGLGLLGQQRGPD